MIASLPVSFFKEQANFKSSTFQGAGSTAPYYGGRNMNSVTSRARVKFDARSDTEWGTLRGFIRIQSTWNARNQALGAVTVPGGAPVAGFAAPLGSDGVVTVDQAFIELGGLRMGYSESAWAQTQGGGNSNWGSHSWGGMYYGYQQRQLVAYTFQGGNGFFGTVSLEDDGNVNYVLDAVVKLGVNQGWGSVWAMVGYDEDIQVGFPAALAATMSGLDGWGAALGVHINIPNMPGDSLRIIGYYADSINAYSVNGSEWSVLASYNHAFSSTLSASVAVQYFNDFYAAAAPFNVSTGVDGWSAELSIVWFPVENFEVRTEIVYDDTDVTTGTTSGFLRFTRYF